MKKISLLFLLLLFANLSCNDQDHRLKEKAETEFVSDHAQLEEAKAISKKLLLGLEKVEKEKLSRSEFESMSRPLQKQLNVLIMALDDKDLQELEDFRNKLLVELAE